jgi:hypothetical protein
MTRRRPKRVYAFMIVGPRSHYPPIALNSVPESPGLRSPNPWVVGGKGAGWATDLGPAGLG